jgi:hypothetical protein
MQNLTVQKVCLALITLAFFIGAPWLTCETLEGNTIPLVTLGTVTMVLLFVYGLGDRCWWIIPFCLSIEGNLNFMPLTFSLQELAILTVFFYLLLKMIFGLDVAWRLGPALIWIPLSAVLAVILYHWITSGDIGIRMLGGSGWGGRKYFKALIASLCVPLLASFPGLRWQDLQRVPLIYFLGSFVDIVPDLLTTFFPASAPLIWRVYSGVNLGEYGAILQGNFSGEIGITRFGTLAKLGIALGLFTVSYFPAYSWLKPNRLWALPVVLMGGILCALSGFRNTILRYALTMITALYATMRFKTLILLPLIAGFALAISTTQGKVFDYPLQIQRALSFLPGDWNRKATREAEGSNRWREKIHELFYKDYFGKAPLLGVGYHFDPNLAKQETDIFLAVAKRQTSAGDEYADVRNFIETRQPHEGTVHILLVTGIVGTVFFVSFCVCLLVYSIASVVRSPPKETTPLQVWAVAMLLPEVLGFFLVFGDLTNFLIRVCPVALLLYRFERLKTTTFSDKIQIPPGQDPSLPPFQTAVPRT